MAIDIKETAQELLKEAYAIKAEEGHYSDIGAFYVSGQKTKKWMNDVYLFSSKLPENYPLRKEIETSYFHRNSASTYFNMVSYLESILSDTAIENSPGRIANSTAKTALTTEKEFDVFISHASKDKLRFVDELNNTISTLDVRIFYDKEVITWGDNWKKKILDGTAKSEFAIIVISDNFFGREWTERELEIFLKQQNSTHQKTVLPLLLGIDRETLKEHYPSLAEIQCISSDEYSVEEISLLFAKELIKRLRMK